MKYHNVVYPEVVKNLAKTGKTNSEIAKILGINIDTLYEWKNKHKAFSDALIEGKRSVDDLVEASMLKSAVGHKVYETHTVQAFDKDGNVIDLVKTIEKQVVGNVRAQEIWLMNRRPDKWKGQPKDDALKEMGVIEIPLTPEEEEHTKNQLAILFPQKLIEKKAKKKLSRKVTHVKKKQKQIEKEKTE